MEDVAQLEQAFRPEARKEGLEGRSDAEMRNLAQEVGTMVFLLYRVCLGTQSNGQISFIRTFYGRQHEPLDQPRQPRSRQLSEAHESAPFREDRLSRDQISQQQCLWTNYMGKRPY